ncbi:MAG: extensin family protein [Rhodobacteraceae bacterium]|nr:MAG: extensin family protein [Paracoccaceae bacterium]
MAPAGRITLALALLFVVGCSSDRGLPIAESRETSTLIGRLNPINAVFRGDLPRSVARLRASARLCGVRGLKGEVIPPITSQVAGCGVDRPVRVTHVDGVKLSQAAIVDCETATALHRWVRRGVKPAVGRNGGGVRELRVAAHYVCRPRNHRAGAQISEHGRGRAIDISGVILADGTEISVLRDWRNSPHSRALQQMHRAACGTFGTTLGPGSDGMHEDHFHYDTARHRGGPYCR